MSLVGWLAASGGLTYSPKPGVHVAAYRKALAGDLAVASTSFHQPNPFVVCQSERYSERWLVRELGSNRTCRYTNENFWPLVGLTGFVFLEGKEYLFYEKVKKALKDRDHAYRFADISFLGDTALVTLRVTGGSIFDNKYSILGLNWRKIRSINSLRRIFSYCSDRETEVSS